MSIIFFPFAFLAGRSWPEIVGRPVRDYWASLLMGIFACLTIGLIFWGWLLFWRGQGHPDALWIAAGTALVFAIVDRILMRCIEVVGGLAVATLLTLRFALMIGNAYFSSHEILIHIFKEQVAAQGREVAVSGVLAHDAAVAKQLGLNEKGAAVSGAQSEMERLLTQRNTPPTAVAVLQTSANACDREAAAVAARLPDRESDHYGTAVSNLRSKQRECKRISGEAASTLAAHQREYDQLIAGKRSELTDAKTAQKAALTEHGKTMKDDSGVITAGITTGFARHNLLWSAVAAGKIPLGSALLLGFVLMVIEMLGFVLKLILPRDPATSERVNAVLTETLHARMEEITNRMALKRVKAKVRESFDVIEAELGNHVKTNVLNKFSLDLSTHTFDRANANVARSMKAGGSITPDMYSRFLRIAQNIGLRKSARATTTPSAGETTPAPA